MAVPAHGEDVYLYRGRPWHRPLLQPPSLIDRLRDSALRWSSHPAVTEVTASGDPARSVTYGELWRGVEARAQLVPADRLGIGQTVAAFVDNSIDSLTTILAIMRTGAAAVVIDAAEPIERRDEMVSSLGCPLMTSGGAVMVTSATPQEGHSFDDPIWPTAIVLFTTGSTAASKPVAQSSYSIAVNAHSVAKHHCIEPGTALACPLPISHANGLELGLFTVLLAGGHVFLMREFDILRFAEVLARTGVELVTTVPSLLDMASSVRKAPDLPRLRYIISAAAPLHKETAQAFDDRFGKKIVQGYGLNECMNFATTMPVRLSDSEYRRLVLEAEIPPVGQALDGCEIAVLDPDGVSLEGAEGEVCVRGHSIMTGYLGRPAATAEAFRGGWLHTGDRGRLDDVPGQGRFLTITGRFKHIAKCGGVGVSLEEVERAVRKSPQVADACCVSRPHRILGEALTLFVKLRAVGSGDHTDGLYRRVGTVIEPRRADLRIVEVATLPKLRSGKPDRRAMAAQAAATSAVGT